MKKSFVIAATLFFASALCSLVLSLMGGVEFGFNFGNMLYAFYKFVIRAVFGFAVLFLFNREKKNPLSPLAISRLTYLAAWLIVIILFSNLGRLVIRLVNRHASPIGGLSQILTNISIWLGYIPGSMLFTSVYLLSFAHEVKFILTDLLTIIDALLFLIPLFYLPSALDDEKEKTAVMNPLSAIKCCFQKYYTFKGCATRSEFWSFILIVNIMQIALAVGIYLSRVSFNDVLTAVLFLFVTIFFTATVLPGTAVTIRRAHDAGYKGIFVWIPLFSLVVLLLPSKKESVYRSPDTPQSSWELPVKILFVIAAIIIIIRLYITVWSLFYWAIL